MTCIGLDHSTTALKVATLDDDGTTDTFAIERIPDDPMEWSFLEMLAEKIDLDEIDMIATGYSYGDDLDAIVPIDEAENRGVIDHMGAGHGFGTGTRVFDELEGSDLPAVVYPGVNEHLETLDPYFGELAMITGADTVAMTRYAQEMADSDDPSFIAASMSSSTMATVVRNGRLRGAFHWMGLVHGIVDPHILRKIDAGAVDPRNAYQEAGMLARRGEGFEAVKGVPDRELLERVCDATVHTVYGLLPFAGGPVQLDDVVLSGRFARLSAPFDVRGRISEQLAPLERPVFCREHSTAIGAALLARDVVNGHNSTLGIPIEPPNAHTRPAGIPVNT